MDRFPNPDAEASKELSMFGKMVSLDRHFGDGFVSARGLRSRLGPPCAGLLLALTLLPAVAPVAAAQEDICSQPETYCLRPGQGDLIDSDRDGLSDQDENYWRLDPRNFDTDGDGLGDGDEFYNRVCSCDPSHYDTDGDRLGDGQEVFGSYGFYTDPFNWDTDGDGYDDWWEIYYGYDPTRAR